jgi:hypothetical protein
MALVRASSSFEPSLAGRKLKKQPGSLATLNGVPFRINPESVEWTFSIKSSDVPTVGGKVIQVYGVDLGDMTVTGSFGKGGWKSQQRFLERMKLIADKQATQMMDRGGRERPQRFVFPAKKWDFLVWLKRYSSPDGAKAVRLHNENFNPKWSLTFQITEDNIGLKTVIKDAYIARLSRGVGWKQTKWNGPLGYAEVQAILNGTPVQTWLDEQQNGGGIEP